MAPKVSAIITTFNRANFLRKSIGSVLTQEYRDFELLILDNSSTDNTEKIVKSFQDNRLRYIKHEPLDISQARNLGIKEAEGEFIGFLDDDDEWLPNKLGAQLEVFAKGNETLALVYGGFVLVDSTGKKLREHKPVLRGNILEDLLAQKDAFTGSASNPLLVRQAVALLGGWGELYL